MTSKRKATAQGEPLYGDLQDDYESDGETSANRKGSSKPGETVVTKRTLQNRKAQREFRKRREARVRDLEERCRRFDQMGLEANVELQRVARNLKEENEALRGFVARIGYGNMMHTILEGVGRNNAASNDTNSFQPAFAGGFGGATDDSKGDDGNDVNSFLDQSHNGRRRSKIPGSAPAHQTTFRDSLASSQWDNHNYSVNNNKSTSEDKHSPSESSDASSSSSNNGALLSLDLQGPVKGQDQQKQPEFTTTSNNDEMNRIRSIPASLTPNSAMATLLGEMNNQMSSGNTESSGLTGSAMLNGFQMPHNSFAPYTVPQRTHQNEALLNPNPIPFAFNLSNEPQQNAQSWWDQMGGGRFTPGNETMELDEKAQAVAAAQINNGGPQSPFDLSAFLQGGMTPGGGYSLGGSSSQDSYNLMDKGIAARSGCGDGGSDDTDHMRMFVRLLEKKVAEREAHTVASLGFQPPSQDPSKRQSGIKEEFADQKPKVTISSSLTPTGVYSRLAEHPAFLSTDARELEELVDALGNGAGRSPSEKKDESKNRKSSLLGKSQVSSPSYMNRMPSEAINSNNSNNNNKRSSSQSSASSSSNTNAHHQNRDSNGSANSSVEVDERAIDRLLGLLDQKKLVRSSEDIKNSSNGEFGQGQHLSMAMT